MPSRHCSHAIAAVLLLTGLVGLGAQQPTPLPPTRGATLYTVFVGQRAMGREDVAVVREADGWVIRGTSQAGPPVDVITRHAEIRYTAGWQPTAMILEGTVRGQETIIKTTFAAGEATSEIAIGGAAPTKKVDKVAIDTVVLPNAFLGSYAALSRRLAGTKAGAGLRAYIAPQGEVDITIDGTFTEQIETPKQTIAATRYALTLAAPAPAPTLQISVWADSDGALLRMSVPSQTLEIAREDIASAATRTSSFSVPGDEALRIPAMGFNLAATVTRPPKATGKVPALVLVGGSGPTDRDGYAFGIPVIGQMARELVDAGFLVVRYDKRGVGQSGGRVDSATLADYAEDVRAILKWLDDEREDVDDKRIGLVGHSEGGLVAMLAARRDDRAAAIALVATPSTTGAELVLEQQQHLLKLTKVPDAEMQDKIEMQKRINQAVISGQGWDDIPAAVRRAADTPWYQSYLLFDPPAIVKDLRQPVLIVQGALDVQVPPHHAEKLAELARARRRKVATDIAIVPGVNHLLVPATTGELDEYGSLADRQVANGVTSAIGTWMAKTFQAIK